MSTLHLKKYTLKTTPIGQGLILQAHIANATSVVVLNGDHIVTASAVCAGRGVDLRRSGTCIQCKIPGHAAKILKETKKNTVGDRARSRSTPVQVTLELSTIALP